MKANLELRHLRYFVAIAEERSVSRAALRLHIAQPPLTRQLRHIEDMLGVPLLVRKARGIDLTPAGRILFDEARAILAQADQAVEKVVLVGEGQIGKLDIGVFGSALFDVIPRLILDFRAVHPGVAVSLYEMNKEEQIKALRDGRIALGFNRFIRDEADIAKEYVLTERLVVACPSGHRLAGAQMVRLTDLRGEPIILYPRSGRPNFADKIIGLCRATGFDPWVVQEVDSVVSATALVAVGMGLAFVADSAMNLALPGVVYRPLEWSSETSVDLYCLYLRQHRLAVLEAFLGVLRGRRGPDPRRNGEAPITG